MSEISLLQYGLVGLAAFLVSIISGVAGYGGGLLLPPLLIPLIGAEAVVPVLGVATLFINGGRLAAFRGLIDGAGARRVGFWAAPGCVAGAFGYTLLSGAAVTLLIGLMLLVLVPLRRWLARRHARLDGAALSAAGAGCGVLMGGTPGAGIVLVAVLMATGLQGQAVLATDAVISFGLGVLKTLVFQGAGALPLSSWMMAGVIGLAAFPGAFVARRVGDSLPLRAHTAILDSAVVLGGLVLAVQGLRALTD